MSRKLEMLTTLRPMALCQSQRCIRVCRAKSLTAPKLFQPKHPSSPPAVAQPACFPSPIQTVKRSLCKAEPHSSQLESNSHLAGCTTTPHFMQKQKQKELMKTGKDCRNQQRQSLCLPRALCIVSMMLLKMLKRRFGNVLRCSVESLCVSATPHTCPRTAQCCWLNVSQVMSCILLC